MYGKNWKKIETFVGTRSSTQIRSHAQKFFNKISKLFPSSNPLEYLQNTDTKIIIGLGMEGDKIEQFSRPALRRERSSSCDMPTIIRPLPIKASLFQYPEEINTPERVLDKEVSSLCQCIESIESESDAVIKSILCIKGLSSSSDSIEASLQIIDCFVKKKSNLDIRAMKIALLRPDLYQKLTIINTEITNLHQMLLFNKMFQSKKDRKAKVVKDPATLEREISHFTRKRVNSADLSTLPSAKRVCI